MNHEQLYCSTALLQVSGDTRYYANKVPGQTRAPTERSASESAQTEFYTMWTLAQGSMTIMANASTVYKPHTKIVVTLLFLSLVTSVCTAICCGSTEWIHQKMFTNNQEQTEAPAIAMDKKLSFPSPSCHFSHM